MCRAAKPLLVTTFAMMAFGARLPKGSLAVDFKLQAFPAPYFGWLAVILIGDRALTTTMKHVNIKRIGWQ